jgi:hypothetical protein
MSLFSRFRNAPNGSTPVNPPQPAPPTPAPPVSQEAASRTVREEETLRSAIAAGDLHAVAKLVIEGSSTKIRQSAAEAIEDLDQIRALLRTAHNDKNVHKILARKRDALLDAEREREKIQTEISGVMAALERHSHRPFDPLFTPTLEQLELRWRAVQAQATQETALAIQQAIDRSREVIAEHFRKAEAKAAREVAAANEAAAAQAQRHEHDEAAARAAAEQAQAQEERRKAHAAKLAAETHALQQITGLVRKAHSALATGSSKSAAGMRRAIEEKLASVPHLPAHLAKQLKQLDAKLEELKDWKSFSVAPKRVDLIERMEALIGADMHPTALVGQIKDLQEQWRTLNKGAGETDDAQWQLFHDAAQKAFEPCRAYYEQQDRIKEENLRQRGVLFERLSAFEQRQNWEDPDWRTVITAVREAKQLWRDHVPIDPTANEELQRRFNELTHSLHVRIDAEYAKNVKQKQSLIERARGLVNSSDVRAAIDEVKRLQEKWKAIGPVPREEDHRLWDEFRQQCDAIFLKRQEERATTIAQLESNKSQAGTLCEQVERIAELSDRELLEGAKRIPELRAAFDAIEDLPKSHARQLRDRFDRALERCRKSVARQQAEDAERGWTELFDAANQVRAYRLALIRQFEGTEMDSLKQRAENSLATLAHSPKRAIEALRTSMTQIPNNDLATNELALKTLCIRAEILTETPTPESDQSLRREYQVKRLMQSMGQGLKVAEGELDSIAIDWLGANPVDEATYLQLLERLMACRKRALRS